jgi:hypothetical protein
VFGLGTSDHRDFQLKGKGNPLSMGIFRWL